jgi:hypothetical protein
MIRYKVENLFALLRHATNLEAQLADRAVLLPGGSLLDSQKAKLLEILIDGEPNFLCEASELEMLDSPTVVTNFYSRVQESTTDYTVSAARAELMVLREHLEFQLESRLFLFVSSDDAKNYKNANVLSEDAQSAFPSAYAELIEAGNCYAVGRADACVFHAMRSLERPIRSLAKRLRVKLSKHPDAATWGEFLSAMDSKLKALSNAKRSTKRDAKLKFYSEARMEFACFKDAWRNFVMHGRENYKPKKAKAILDDTCAFVERLSKDGLTGVV